MNVILVHGILDSGWNFWWLQRRLKAAGHRGHAPTLSPRDGRRGIADLAHKLARYIGERLPAESPLALVGFSMGCLVARYYLQCLGGKTRARAFFAISGPMHGTVTAYFYPGQGARDMRPGSPLVRGLERTAVSPEQLPQFTYYTPLDLIILPPKNSGMKGAPELRVWAPLHPLMLYSGKVAADICRRLDSLEQPEASTAAVACSAQP